MFGGKKKDNELDDNDLFMFTRYKPLGLDNLCKATHFNKKEIRLMYQGFKQECPTGVCSEEDFKCIFAKYFPQGEKLRWIFGLYDINGDGFISKSEMLIIVSAIYDMLGEYAVPIVDAAAAKEHVDKLFHLIDADKDGVISFDEFADWCQKDEGRAQALLMFDTIF